MDGIEAIRADIEWIKQTLEKIDQRLDRIDQGHKEEINNLKRDFEKQIDELKNRIQKIESDVNVLQRFRYAVYITTTVTWAILTALARFIRG